ncbi:MAG: HDOD domain-containing protein [Planctomycetota bacterium]
MSATTKQEETVAAAIREIGHIATLPEVTSRIIELVENPNSTAQELHDVISGDPALCSRILKVVNSSFYGLPGQVASVNRAIVLLGLNAVKNIAIAASLAKLYRGGDLTPRFSAREIWSHSAATAAAAKLVNDTLKLGLGDEAFLAGLIHDIGVMVEMQYDRAKLIDVVESLGIDADGAPANDMREIEQQIFGADHCQFGAALCERWRFPSSFVNVTAFHHDPMAAPADARSLPCVIYLADRLAGSLPDAYRHDIVDLVPDQAVLDAIGLSLDKFNQIAEQLTETVAEAASLLD